MPDDTRISTTVSDRIGSLVRSRRRALGWSLAWLSARMEACGGPSLSASTLSRLERGFVRLDVREASALSRALGFSFHALAATMQVRRVTPPEVKPSSMDELYQLARLMHARYELERLADLLEWSWDHVPLDVHAGTNDGQEERALLALCMSDTFERLDQFGIAAYFNRLARRGTRRYATRMMTLAQYANQRVLTGSLRDAELLFQVIVPALPRLGPVEQAYVLHSLGAFEFRRTNHRDVDRWMNEAIPLWQEREGSMPMNELRARATIGLAAMELGRRNEGRRIIGSVIADAQSIDCVVAVVYVNSWLERLGIAV